MSGANKKTNTGHKYITHTDGRFIVQLPPEVSARNGGQQTINRKRLPDAIYQRNAAFGFDPDLGPQPTFKHEPILMPNNELVRFGALGDTHLCSIYEDLKALNKYYDELAHLGVSVAFLAGNWVDGDKYSADIHTWGIDRQIEYFLANYPQREGIKTYVLDGDDHEGWWYKTSGVVPGQLLIERARSYGRDDLFYLGYMEADVRSSVSGRPFTIKVMHGGGGSAKSISLAAQNAIDGRMTNAEAPDILLLGHYHKAHFLPNYRGVFTIQVGTFERQSPFMRGKNIMAAIGGWTVEVWVGADERLRVGATYHSFKPAPWKHAPIPVEL